MRLYRHFVNRTAIWSFEKGDYVRLVTLECMGVCRFIDLDTPLLLADDPVQGGYCGKFLSQPFVA